MVKKIYTRRDFIRLLGTASVVGTVAVVGGIAAIGGGKTSQFSTSTTSGTTTNGSSTTQLGSSTTPTTTTTAGTTTTGSTTGTTTIGASRIPYHNYRDVCVKPCPVASTNNGNYTDFSSMGNFVDGIGAPPASTIFPLLKQMGINRVRWDSGSWLLRELSDLTSSQISGMITGIGNLVNSIRNSGGTPPTYLTYLYDPASPSTSFLPVIQANPVSWASRVNYTLNNADAAGVDVSFGCSCWYDPRYCPTDEIAWDGGLSGVHADFLTNSLWKGRNYDPLDSTQANIYPWASKYQGLSLWEAEMVGYWQPTLAVALNHKSFVQINAFNEPNTTYAGQTSTIGPSFYSYYKNLATRLKDFGFNGYISFMPCVPVPTVTDWQNVVPFTDNKGRSLSGQVVINGHYPTFQMLADMQTFCSQNNCLGWIGEDFNSYLIGVGGSTPNAVQIASYGFPAAAFACACQGGSSSILDTKANGCGVLTTFNQLVAQYNQAYGQAIFN